MSQVFNYYSEYYDLLYQDKNYNAEVEYLVKLIRQHSPKAKTILELGCGTGLHAIELARNGYKVYGVDLSEWMLNKARSRDLQNLDVHFQLGDVRNFSSSERFDTILSLFHVVSYQNSNQDLKDTLRVANNQLSMGGVFIFDFWYGPCVLTERPEERTKIIENSKVKVIRQATPTIRYNDNVVEVKYTVNVTDKQTNHSEDLSEVHKMRYFFFPELTQFLELCGFSVLDFHEWMTKKMPSEKTWGVTIVAKKVVEI